MLSATGPVCQVCRQPSRVVPVRDVYVVPLLFCITGDALEREVVESGFQLNPRG